MRRNTVGARLLSLMLGVVMFLAACGKAQPTPKPPPTETTIPIVAASTEIIGQNPSPRGYTSMAYDIESNQVILYGGQTGNYTNANNISSETWAYDLGTNKWTQMEPPIDPGKRAAAELAYDSESDRVILFGGCYNCDTAVLNDTWAYDFNTNTWTEMKAKGPANTIGARLAYDAESDRIILFYGPNETWAYDYNTDTWTDMQPTIGSTAFRNYHAMSYDSKADRVLVWGGAADGNLSIWSYDFNTNIWQEIKPTAGISPRYRDYPIFVYDEESDRTILYGGYPNYDENVWAYDFNTKTWAKMQSSMTPGELSRHDMVYNTTADRIILFGGQIGSNYSAETWAYDFNHDKWTNMTPSAFLSPTAAPTTIPTEIAIGLSPSARGFAAMTYDAESDRIILFGGAIGDFRSAAFIDGETWAYDATINKWTHMEPSLSPQKRISAYMAYDSESDRVILFGGLRVLTSAENDTWAYDFNTNTWTKMIAKGPAKHEGARLAYDAESDRIILFGGYDGNSSTYYNDTWAYDFNTDSWTEMNPKTSPPGRNYQAMTYDSKADRVLTWGGLDDDRNPIDESMWAYDYNTNTWNEIKPAQEIWPRGRDFPVMVYDSKSDRTILHGGDPIGHETWVYDFNTNAWEKLKPNTSPGRVSRHTMVYNPVIDRVILFGGQTGSVSFTYNDKIWFFDYNTNNWTNMTSQP